MVIGKARLEAPAKVGRDGRGHRVHAAVESGHGRGEQTGDHQPRHPGRQLLDDEPREDLLVPRKRRQPIRMRAVESPQRRAQPEKQQAGRCGEHGVGPHGSGGLFFVGRRQVALHDSLIRSVGYELLEELPDHDHPHGGRGDAPAGREGGQFLFRSGHRIDRAEPALQVAGNQNQADHPPA